MLSKHILDSQQRLKAASWFFANVVDWKNKLYWKCLSNNYLVVNKITTSDIVSCTQKCMPLRER